VSISAYFHRACLFLVAVILIPETGTIFLDVPETAEDRHYDLTYLLPDLDKKYLQINRPKQSINSNINFIFGRYKSPVKR